MTAFKLYPSSLINLIKNVIGTRNYGWLVDFMSLFCHRYANHGHTFTGLLLSSASISLSSCNHTFCFFLFFFLFLRQKHSFFSRVKKANQFFLVLNVNLRICFYETTNIIRKIYTYTKFDNVLQNTVEMFAIFLAHLAKQKFKKSLETR